MRLIVHNGLIASFWLKRRAGAAWLCYADLPQAPGAFAPCLAMRQNETGALKSALIIAIYKDMLTPQLPAGSPARRQAQFHR